MEYKNESGMNNHPGFIIFRIPYAIIYLGKESEYLSPVYYFRLAISISSILMAASLITVPGPKIAMAPALYK